MIVPSIRDSLLNGDRKEFEILAELFAGGWKSCEILCGRSPHPDQTVGFTGRSFTKDQLRRLDWFYTGTQPSAARKVGCMTVGSELLFPFFSAHIKMGDLASAERQNVHSAVTSLRNLVKLMRIVGRERELDREVCFFSMAYNQKEFAIYGHFAIIEGDNTRYYRHLLLRGNQGGDFSRAYQLILSVYMPTDLDYINSFAPRSTNSFSLGRKLYASKMKHFAPRPSHHDSQFT